MPNALIYYNKFKNLFKNNRLELEVRNGFFPYVILLNNKEYIEKEDFVKADHPITLELFATNNKSFNKIFKINNLEKKIINDNKDLFSIFYYSLLTSIWYFMSKDSSKHLEELNYENTVKNLHNLIEFKNFNLYIKNNSDIKFFIEPKRLLSKFKNEIL